MIVTLFIIHSLHIQPHELKSCFKSIILKRNMYEVCNKIAISWQDKKSKKTKAPRCL